MNKLIIICGGDRLGKGSLVKGLAEYFDYKNITVRHCDKPPKNLVQTEVLDYQIKAFEEEFNLIIYTQCMNRKFLYHDNIMIYDRFYLGEYVYGQMFRNYDAKLIKAHILALEESYIKMALKYSNVYLITLTADPKFFYSREDGKSFSNNIEDKTRELELFKEAHNFSMIPNKLLVKVDHPFDVTGEIGFSFRGKEQILNEVIEFIDGKK